MGHSAVGLNSISMGTEYWQQKQYDNEKNCIVAFAVTVMQH